MKPIPFRDIGDESEDERIRQIGEAAKTKIVGFFIDDEAGKAERYVDALKERYPDIKVLYIGAGPVPGTVFVKVCPKTKVN